MSEPTTTPETGDSGDEHTTTDTPTDAPGAFYLGRGHDLESGTTDGERLEYPSRDLTTHAVCVGMTGSGKTGLCVGLLEEAGLDGVPAIVIDPKGDIPNLLLTFPELRGEDFEPWVDDGEAERKGQTVPEFAASRAALWRKGLGDWGIEGDRIARFRDRVDLTVYTPGSSAGVGLSPLRSLSAPSEAVREDGEALRERVSASVSGLLSMLGVESDPLTGREHIFLSTIVERAWSAGESLDLAGLIGAVQAPGFDRVGVLALDEFMSARARSDLAMRLNTLLASPGFRSWLEGEPLDIGAMLRTKEGKPRISIVSIAHL
ncbi:MAG: ATP-binding protein, partial [Planctomycetota bacterium]